MEAVDRIRVLHCTTSLVPDGAQQMLLKLVTARDKAKFEVCVVSLLRQQRDCISDSLRQAGVRVETLNMEFSRPSLSALRDLSRLIRDFKPDILQGWMYHGNIALFLGKVYARSKAPLIWNIRNSLNTAASEKRLTRILIRLSSAFSKCAKRIVYNARTSAGQHEKLGFSSINTTIIPNGFDTEQFKPNGDAREALLVELALPAETRLIGMVGRFHPVKDFPTALRALPLVLEEIPNACLVLVGRDVDCDNQKLSSIVSQLGIGENVRLLGQRSEIERIIAAFDLFCLTSRSEGFPNALGEAMACGVPCVVTDVGACRELVDGIGRIVPPGSYEDLAEGLKELLRLPEAALSELGADCRKRMLERYSLEQVARCYESLYQELRT